jgi:hypothetical protein
MREKLIHAAVLVALGAVLYTTAADFYTANTAKILLFGYVLLSPRLFEFLAAVFVRRSAQRLA